MTKARQAVFRIISVLLIAALLCQDMLWAHPNPHTGRPSSLQIPSSLDPANIDFLAKFTAEYFARKVDTAQYRYPLAVPLPGGKGIIIYNFSKPAKDGRVRRFSRDNPSVFAIKGADGKRGIFSGGMRQYAGRTRTRWSADVYPEDRQSFWDKIRETLASGISPESEALLSLAEIFGVSRPESAASAICMMMPNTGDRQIIMEKIAGIDWKALEDIESSVDAAGYQSLRCFISELALPSNAIPINEKYIMTSAHNISGPDAEIELMGHECPYGKIVGKGKVVALLKGDKPDVAVIEVESISEEARARYLVPRPFGRVLNQKSAFFVPWTGITQAGMMHPVNANGLRHMLLGGKIVAGFCGSPVYQRDEYGNSIVTAMLTGGSCGTSHAVSVLFEKIIDACRSKQSSGDISYIRDECREELLGGLLAIRAAMEKGRDKMERGGIAGNTGRPVRKIPGFLIAAATTALSIMPFGTMAAERKILDKEAVSLIGKILQESGTERSLAFLIDDIACIASSLRIEDAYRDYLKSLSEKAVASDMFAATVSACLKKKVVFAFDSGMGGAYSAKVNAVMETLESLKKDPRYSGLLENNLIVFSSVPKNLAAKVEEHIKDGSVVFTFARLCEKEALAAVEGRVIPSYVDVPGSFPEDAYIPVPEIAAIALGRYLNICDPSTMPEYMLNEINISKIDPQGDLLIFRLLPKPLLINTEEESVRRYLLLKRFLEAA
ncbi:MAG: hypothetical protein JXB40_01485 [Candidatus Omnitrophica bacterium]|nr:hypothetical protein [Candidatus Omnitrophota bacterium]